MGHNPGIGTDQTYATSGGGDAGGELAPGSMVGEYRIEGTLGEGGMGRVYSATHPVIAKRAAIKILHPELSAHREAVDRFVREARSVNEIGHPNIVDIFSFGTMPDGRSYFVMEWLRGESLRDRIAKSRLPLGDVLQILDTVSVALEAAHEKGIVHRDLKPDNIFLVDVKGDKPQVKLLDFGIAKLMGGNDQRMERTRTGNLMGTPAYISPEQARGHAVDHRTDIYALGAVAYELLTADLPFPADNAADMIAKHLFAPPPSAAALNPEVTPELDELVKALLAKDANARPTLVATRERLRSIRARLAYNMYIPQDGGYTEPQIQAQHTPVPGMRTPMPQYTPSGQYAPAPAQLTPAPQRTDARFASTAGDPSLDVPPRRSKAPFFAIAGVLGIAIGVAVVVAVTSSSDTTEVRANEPATPTEQADKPAAAAAGSAATAPAAVGETKPAETEPAEPVETKPVEPTETKPAEPTETKPAEPTATAKPTTKPTTKRTTTTRKKTTPKVTKPADDDDAPM